MPSDAAQRQWGAAVLLGLCVPALTLLCGFSWASVLLGAAAATGLLWAVGQLERKRERLSPTALRYGVMLPIALVFLLLAARLAAISPQFFPQSGGAAWIGLGVLVLAAAAADRGPAAVLRCAAILLLPVGAVFAATLLLALPQLRLRWLTPALDLQQIAESAAALLCAGTAFPLLGGRRRQSGRSLPLCGGGLLAVCTAAICAGCLSPRLAAGGQGFLTLSRSLSLFGVMLRLEALVYGALTACVFVACALLLCLAGAVFPKTHRARILPGLLCAALLYPSLRIPRELLLLGGSVSGVFLAAFPQAVAVKTGAVRGLKKAEKKLGFLQNNC